MTSQEESQQRIRAAKLDIKIAQSVVSSAVRTLRARKQILKSLLLLAEQQLDLQYEDK